MTIETKGARIQAPSVQPSVDLASLLKYDAGIYAIAEILETPTLIPEPPDIGYWLDKSLIGQRPQAIIRFTDKFLERPLLKRELAKDPVLKSLTVIRQPNSTNFKVSPEEWKRVYELKSQV